MGTLSYILLTYIHYIGTLSKPKLKMPKGSGLTKPLNLSAELATLLGEKKGALLSRQEAVGLHQGEEAPGLRQQAVLPPRQSHAANLRNGEGESFRYGQAPEGPPYSLSEITPFESIKSSQNLKLSMDFCGDSVIQDFAALF